MVETWFVAAVVGPNLNDGWMPFHTSVTCWFVNEPLYFATTPAVQVAFGAAHNELPASAPSRNGCGVTPPPVLSCAAILLYACAYGVADAVSPGIGTVAPSTPTRNPVEGSTPDVPRHCPVRDGPRHVSVCWSIINHAPSSGANSTVSNLSGVEGGASFNDVIH